MKKRNFKKIFTAAFSAVCMTSLTLTSIMPAMPVSAAVDVNDTINTDMKGSLTIHKYDITAATEDGVSVADYFSDGKQNAAAESALADYAIPDVVFSYVKVSDIQTVSEVKDGESHVQLMYTLDTELESILKLKNEHGDHKYTSDAINKAMKTLLDGDNNTTGKNALERYIKGVSHHEAFDKTDAQGIAKVSGLDLGLYLVVETQVPANVQYTTDPFFVTIPMTTDDGDSWFYDLHVYPKNQTDIPTLDKKVRQNDDTAIGNAKGEKDAKYYDYGTGSEGDVMEYILVARIPKITSEASYLTTWEFIDEVDYGLTYNQDSFNVYIYNTEADATEADPSKAVATMSKDKYTLSFDTHTDSVHNGFTLSMNAAGLEEINHSPKYAEKYMTVCYKATMDSSAKVVLGDTGNVNDVSLTWKRTFQTNFDHLYDEVRVYSFGLNILKTFEDATGQATGRPGDATKVQFILQNATDGHYVTATGSNGVYYVTDGNKTADREDAFIFSPAADGSLVINGLEADITADGHVSSQTYILTEVQTSDGYSLLKEPITIVIDGTDASILPSLTELYDVKDAAKNTADGRDSFTYTLTDNADATVDGNATAMTADNASVNARVELTVVNHSQFLLPPTGGYGTIIFTLIGCAAAFAGVMVIVRHKKDETVENA